MQKKAEELKKITEQAEIECANKFWEEFKDRLFKELRNQAECRCYSLTIRYSDDLSKSKIGADWISYKPLREKVKQELESLGYEFSYDDNRQGDYVTISWK